MDMVLSEGTKSVSDLIIGLRCGASLPFGTPRLTPPEGAIIAGVPVAGNVLPLLSSKLKLDIRFNSQFHSSSE
jgi:hypothetical protein